MKPLLFGFGLAAGLILIPAIGCALIEWAYGDINIDMDLTEDDGFITVHPELRA